MRPTSELINSALRYDFVSDLRFVGPDFCVGPDLPDERPAGLALASPDATPLSSSLYPSSDSVSACFAAFLPYQHVVKQSSARIAERPGARKHPPSAWRRTCPPRSRYETPHRLMIPHSGTAQGDLIAQRNLSPQSDKWGTLCQLLTLVPFRLLVFCDG